MLWSYNDDFPRTIAPLSSRRPLSQRDCSFAHGQNNLNDGNHRSIPQAKAPVFARGVLTRQRLEPSLTGTEARHEVPGLEFGHFEDGLQGAARSVAKAIGEEESKINEAQRKAKQLVE